MSLDFFLGIPRTRIYENMIVECQKMGTPIYCTSYDTGCKKIFFSPLDIIISIYGNQTKFSIDEKYANTELCLNKIMTRKDFPFQSRIINIKKMLIRYFNTETKHTADDKQTISPILT